MPSVLYTSPEIFALEREALFLKHWFFLCRDEQLPDAGDYRTFDTPGGPVLLVRGQDKVLRCFANVCRHRGSLLLKGSGNCGARIMCPLSRVELFQRWPPLWLPRHGRCRGL